MRKRGKMKVFVYETERSIVPIMDSSCNAVCVK